MDTSPPLQPWPTGAENLSPQRRTVSYIMCRRTQLLQLQSYFHSWLGYIQRQQKLVHMKRCAVVLKHSNHRREYTRLFMRWIAAVQQRACEEARAAVVIPKDVPLHSKREVLALASTYYSKWRLFLRRSRQRKCTNVELLAGMNEERVRYRVMQGWLRWCLHRHGDVIQSLKEQRESATRTAQYLRKESHALQAELQGLAHSIREKESGADVLHKALHEAHLEIQQLRQTVKDHEKQICSLQALRDTQEKTIEHEALTSQREVQRLGADLAWLHEKAEVTEQQRRAEIATLREAAVVAIQSLVGSSGEDYCVGESTELPDISTRHSKAIADALVQSVRTANDALHTSKEGTQPITDRLKYLQSQTIELEIEFKRVEEGAADMKHILDDIVQVVEKVISDDLMGADNNAANDSERRNRFAVTIPQEKAVDSQLVDATARANRLAGVGDGSALAVLDRGRALALVIMNLRRDMNTHKERTALLFAAAAQTLRVLGGPDGSPHAHMAEDAIAELAGALGRVTSDLSVLLTRASLASPSGETHESLRDAIENLWRVKEAYEKETIPMMRQRLDQLHGIVGTAATALESYLAREQASGGSNWVHEDVVAQAQELEGEGYTAPTRLLKSCEQLLEALDTSKEQLHGREGQIAEMEAAALATIRVLGNSGNVQQSQGLAVTLEGLTQGVEESLQSIGKTTVPEAIRALGETNIDANQKLEHLQEERTALLDVITAVQAVLGVPQTDSAPVSADSAAPHTAMLKISPPTDILFQLEHLRDAVLGSLLGLPNEPGRVPLTLQDSVRLLGNWKRKLLEDLQESIEMRAKQEAIGMFLRDVLRDTLVGLRQASPGEVFPRTSPVLPMCHFPLSSDPSHYVALILQTGTINEAGRIAVQSHLSSRATLGEGPSTWDVLVELRDRVEDHEMRAATQGEFLEEEKDRANQLAGENEVMRDAMFDALTNLNSWCSTTQQGHDSPQSDHPLVVAASDISRVLARLTERVSQATLQDERASPNATPPIEVTSLRTFEDAVSSICDRLEAWQSTAEVGIAALGGKKTSMTGEVKDEVAWGIHSTGPVRSQLVALCQDTGSSIEEVRTILGVSRDDPKGLRKIISCIREKVHELDEARQESEYLVRHLDVDLSDDSLSSTIASHKALKPKKKPLPALEGDCSIFELTRREVNPCPSEHYLSGRNQFSSAEQRMRAFRMKGRAKLNDVQHLIQLCRVLLSLLDGSYEEGKKPPPYGSVLTAMLTAEIEDIKKVLPRCGAALQEREGPSVSNRSSLGVRLQQLADLVVSLRIERDGLKDELNGRSKQSAFLMNSLENQAAKFHEETAGLHSEIRDLATQRDELAKRGKELTERLHEEHITCTELRAASLQLHKEMERLSDALEDGAADGVALSLQSAVQQHRTNVLLECLGRVILAAPTATAHGRASEGMVSQLELEHVLSAYLTKEEGEPLLRYIDEHIGLLKQERGTFLRVPTTLLENMRAELVQMRAYVKDGWEGDMKSYCVKLLQEAEEAWESDMLRLQPREREALLQENESLRRSLEQLHANTVEDRARLQKLEVEHSSLWCALREAEVTQVLRDGPDALDAKVPLSIMAAAHNWEERMIHGATALTMDAIESFAGKSMTSTFGSVAEDLLTLHQLMDQCVRETRTAYQEYRHVSSGGLSDQFLRTLDRQMHELQKLSTTAERVYAQMPLILHSPYYGQQ